MDVHCRGTLSQSDSYIGYEGYLSYNNQFKYSIQVSQAVNVVDGAGNVCFSSLDTGYSYYIKVRSYTIHNNVKIVGPWSEIRKADLPTYKQKKNPIKTSLSNLLHMKRMQKHVVITPRLDILHILTHLRNHLLELFKYGFPREQDPLT